MLILAAFDNWIFLVVVAVAALLRWLASKAAAAAKPNDSQKTSTSQSERPVREGASSDEEQIRRFLEALGQPRGAKVPPPVPPRTDVAPRPVAPVRPPLSPIPQALRPRRAERSKEVSRPSDVVVVEPAAPQRTYQPRMERREAPVFEVHEASQPLPEVESPTRVASTPRLREGQVSVTLAQLLQTPEGLRRAIILREIFGPPRSLQPMQDLPGTA